MTGLHDDCSADAAMPPTLIERLAARFAPLPKRDTAISPSPEIPPNYAGPEATNLHQDTGQEIRLEKLRQHSLLAPGSSGNSLSEAFRIAKRHLLFAAFGSHDIPAVERGRLIVITSAFPNEGKTFCSINIALSLAGEKDVEVLLIDGDTIKPEILSLLGIGGGGGLMDALASNTPPERYIIQTSIPNLSVLPAGRRVHDDIELLSSQQMRAFVDRMLAEKPSRILVFDSAPTLSASTGPTLGALAGQVLMVVRADRTREERLADAVRLFASHKGLKFLMNRTTFAPPGDTYGYYYGYQR